VHFAGSTPCFEDLVIRGIVNVVFLLLLLFRLQQLHAMPYLPYGLFTESKWVFITKLLASALNGVMPIFLLVSLFATDSYATFELVAEPVTAAVWLLMTATIAMEHYVFRASGRWVLPFLWLFALVADAVRFRSRRLLSEVSGRDVNFVLFVIAFVALCILMLLGYFARTSDLTMLRQIKAAARKHKLAQTSSAGASSSDPTAGGTATAQATPALDVETGEGSADIDDEIASELEVFLDGTSSAFLEDKMEGSHADAARDAGHLDQSHLRGGRHPEERADVCSRITFSWMTPLLALGNSRPLVLEDVFELRPQFKVNAVSASFDAAWQAELTRAAADSKRHEATLAKNPNSKPEPAKHASVYSALNTAFGFKFWLAAVPYAVQIAAQYVSPLLLRRLIQLVQEGDGDGIFGNSNAAGYLLAVGMAASLVLTTLMENIYFDMVIKVGEQARSAMTAAIFAKSLRLSNSARQARSVGEISNLISADAERAEMLSQTLHSLWSAPVRIAIGLGLLFDGLGAAAFVGFTLLLIAVPLQGVLFGKSAKHLRAMLTHSDGRIKATNEMLGGMEVIKFYGWEEAFQRHIGSFREKELKFLWFYNVIMSVVLFMVQLNPVLLTVGCFGAYALIEGNLDAETAFFSLSLIGLLYFPIIMLPRSIQMLLQVTVSIRRIESFLQAEEMDIHSTPQALGGNNAALAVGQITLQDVWLTWESAEERAESAQAKAAGKVAGSATGSIPYTAHGDFVLRSVTLQLPANKLVAVVGATGSGKSSLLSGVLGECSCTSGAVAVKGSISYASQKAWIFNATVRENVLFGQPFDKVRYDKVLDVCQLRPDLEQWVGGDMVEIGERGVNLSGGQRQRVNMARAAYAETDIILMDDILSALDAKVGAALFREAVQNFLLPRTRVMVTNQLQFLPHVDYVIVIGGGGVAEAGKYDELMGNPTGALRALVAKMGEGGAEEAGTVVESDQGEGEGEVVAPAQIVAELSTGEKDANFVATTSAAAPAPGALTRGKSKNSKSDAARARITRAEARATGSISWEVYMRYAKEAGGVRLLVIVILLNVLGNAARVGSSFWLAEWASDTLGQTLEVYVGVYFALSVVFGIATLLVTLVFAVGAWNASKELHSSLVGALLRVPLSFMHATPVGRILNRATKDVRDMDTQVLFNLTLWASSVFALVGTVVVIAVVSPYAAVLFVPAGLGFYFLQAYYRQSSRELKRVDAVSRSPLYAHFSETLAGMSIIRAYAAEGRMTQMSNEKLDTNIAVILLYFQTNRWLSVRLESLSAVIVLAAGVFAVLSRDTLDAALVGLSLSYSLTISQQAGQLVRFSTMAEATMASVERVVEYADEESEAPLVIPTKRPPANWPTAGEVVYENLTMSYRPDLPPVLRNLSFTLKAGEKVGLVGRTGAGKSSIFQSLYRIVEATSGRILIDGEDIAQFGLHDVRGRALSIIPQEPTLFSGSIRSNLDPFSEYTDAQLWQALEKAQLEPLISAHRDKLAMPIQDGGSNLSVGQRQLLCLARALLRHTKVLVVDEATANVDVHSDALVQSVLRRDFADRTVITIAHRLNTIIDSDRIVVLDQGQVLEVGTPAALLANPESAFSKMVNETGPIMSAFLRRAATGEVDYAKELEAAAAQAASAMESSVTRGPRMTSTEAAVEAVRDAIKARHGAEWSGELNSHSVPKAVWLQHLYTLLAVLETEYHDAAETDEVDINSLMPGAGAPVDALAADDMAPSSLLFSRMGSSSLSRARTRTGSTGGL
jgi:ABC-type multidrug transport system fused ATPase/permease subunit